MTGRRVGHDTVAGQGFLGRSRGITAVALAICLAAFNSGNNIFYLVASILFAMVVLSAWRGRRVVREIRLRAYVGADGLFAGRRGPVELEVLAPEPVAVHLSHDSWPAGVTAVAHPRGCRADVAMVPARRGWDWLPSLSVVTRGPFGITRHRRRTLLGAPVLVFPEPEASYDLRADIPTVARSARLSASAPGAGGDFLAVRDYRPEDGVRRVYWRGLARTGRLLSTVTEREEDAALTLVISNLLDEDNPARRAVFESALSRITAAALQAHERGIPYRLVTPDGIVPTGSGSRHRHAVLSRLALLEPRVAPGARWRQPSGSGVIEFHTSGGGDD